MKHLPVYKVLCLLIVFSAGIAPGFSSNQKQKNQTVLIKDSRVVCGKLPNGFTYYIRHNEEPKKRVTLYLVNKVGSILETDNQRGLAHFMEHMSFNGTTHFPKNELVNYLQKSGVKFGSDLNAYTSYDETVYQLPLPTDDPALLQNGFQIMRDWAQDATLDSEEIEKERGVVLEEKRLRSGANTRIQQRFFPILTNGSKYAYREPIGTEEVLKGFQRSTLLDFYRWYRPDLQALIVVGDIDVQATEKTIKSMFGNLKNPPKAPERTAYRIPLTGKNQFLQMTDKELTMPVIQMMWKFEKEPMLTKTDYRRSICRALLNHIVNERIEELSKQANSPFVEAWSGAGGMIANLEMWSTEIVAQPSRIEQSFKTVWTEMVRMKKYGVTPQELTRAKQSYMKRMETTYNERQNTPSESYVKEYMEHFLHATAFPGIEAEYALSKELMPTILENDLKALFNQYVGTANRDMLVAGAKKDSTLLPSEKTIETWMNEVEQSNIQARSEQNTDKPLMGDIKTSGKIVTETKDSIIGTVTLTLSNGLKVLLKPTDYKKDEILLSAFSPGGTSLYSDEDYQSASIAADLVNSAGLGEFSSVELQKLLTGKNVQVAPFISEKFEGFNGKASGADIETALQLVHLYFTNPGKDFSVIKTDIKRMKSSLANRGNDPSTVFSDTLAAVLSNYNPRRTAPTVEKLNRIDFEKAFSIYKERFSDASDFTFTLVGSFRTETIKPMIEKYLGTLPYTGRKESARNLHIHIPEGKIEKTVRKGMDNKSMVRLIYSGTYAFGETENQKIEAIADLLTIKLTEKLREEESGVYGVRASAQHTKYPENRYALSIGFGCAPANVDKLIRLTMEVVQSLKTQPASASDLEKVVSEDLWAMEVNQKNNSFWMKYLNEQMQNNEELSQIMHYAPSVQSITPAALMGAAQQYLTGNNLARMILMPENK